MPPPPPPPPPTTESPLFAAAVSGNIATFEALWTSDAQAIVDPDGKNALFYAAGSNQRAAVEWLLAHGVDLKATTRKGLTAFHFAVSKGHRDIAALLLERGAELSAVDSAGEPALAALLAPPRHHESHCQSGAGRNALHVACANGALDLARWLMGLGLDVEATTADGLRAVHVAALGGHIDVLRWLVDAGGAGALPGTATTIGVTALHCACMKGHT